MEWVVGFFAVLLIVFSRRFRIFAIGAVAVFGSYYFAQSLWDKHERAEARERVTLSEFRIDKALLHSSPDTLWRLTGRAYNLSKDFDIKQFEVTISIRDCADKECTIIAQSNEVVYQDIPANQARDLNELVSIEGVSPDAMKTMDWDYTVNYIEAAEPK